MELQKIMEMTNGHGKEFLRWFENCSILGTEVTEENSSRKEFTFIYRHEDGKVCAAVLPVKESSNNGCCCFGNLEHFAMAYAAGKSGIRLLPRKGGFMWPVWYTEQKDFERWRAFYDEIIEKYS